MGSATTLARGAGILLLGIFISKILMYAYRILIARSLGPESYGIIMIAVSIVSFGYTISLLGMEVGIVRFISYYLSKKEYGKIRSLIKPSIIIAASLSAFMSLVLFLSSKYISEVVFSNVLLSPVLKITSVGIFVISLQGIFIGISRSYKKIEYIAYAKYITENLTKVVFTAIILYLGYELIGVAVAYVLALIATLLFFIYLVNKDILPLASVFKSKRAILKPLLRLSIPLMFSTLLWRVIIWTDTLMLGYFLEESFVGIYNAAVPLAFMIFIAPVSVGALFLPVITEKYAKKESIKLDFYSVTKWILLINIPLIALFGFYGTKIIGMLFGPAYVAGSSVLFLLSVGYFINSFSYNSKHVLTMLKRTKIILMVTGTIAIANIFLNYFLIPIYGITGAATASAISLSLEAIVLLIIIYKKMRLFPIRITLLKAITAGVIGIFIADRIIRLLFPARTIYILVFGTALFGVLYLMLLILLRCFNKTDIEVVKSIQSKTGIDFTSINRIIGKFIR